MSDSSSLSTPTPTPDSVLSPAPSWRRLSNGGDDGDERKGKKRGWGKLPPAILNHILSFVLSDTDHFKTPYLAARNSPDLASPELEYIAVLAQRKWMSEVKNVCFHWHHSIIQHPWWVCMALTLAGRTIHDFHFDRLTRSYHNSSSGGPFPFFQAHYILDGHVCYVCRMVHPDTIRRCCHTPENWIWSPRLGILEVCGHHALRTCVNCLSFIDSSRPPSALALVSSARGDRNEDGQALSSFAELVCAPCRSLALARAINVVLHNTARGSRWTGKARAWRSEPGFISYVQHGNFGLDVFATAQQIIERAWLVDHTCFNELQDDFDKAMNLEAAIRHRFMASGEAHQPERLVNMMSSLLGWSEDKCWNEIRRKGALWDRDQEQGVQSGMNPFQIARSSREWYERQKDRAIRHWIHMRITYGFWFTPSEEIRQHVELGHTSLPLLGRSADWVFPPDAECDDVDISNAMFERHGLIDLEAAYDAVEEDTKFFPPSALLVSLNELFHQQLYRRVLPALGEVVKNMVDVWEGEQRAEEAARDYGLEDILMDLQIKESWIKSRPPGCSKSASPYPSPAGIAVVAPLAVRKSPRIEVRIEHPPPHRILQVQEDDAMSISDDSDDSDLATEIDDDVGRGIVPSTAQISWVRDVFIPDCIRNKEVTGLMEIADKMPALRARVEEAIMEVVMRQSADDLQPADSDSAAAPATAPEDAGRETCGKEGNGEMEVEVEVEKEEIPSTINSPIGPHSAIPSEKTRSSSEGTNDAMPITPPDAPTRTLPDVVHVAEEGDGAADTAMVDPLPLPPHPHPTPQVAKPPQLPSSSEASTPNSSSSSASLFEETRIIEKQSAPSPPDIRSHEHNDDEQTTGEPEDHDHLNHEAAAPQRLRKNSVSIPDWVVPYDLIPWIPAPDLSETGILAEDTIMKAWWDARAWLRECRCSICERGKKRMRDEEAGGKWHPRNLPGMEGVFGDGDGKKRRIF